MNGKNGNNPLKYSIKDLDGVTNEELETVNNSTIKEHLGTKINDLANILKFTAFWIDKMNQHNQWIEEDK